YLFLALWFGMHAFVSSQAYKVRILTQLVRLPVPTWRSLEAARTYSSAFEKLPKGQMLRVPFAMGSQEEQAPRPGSQETSADPWPVRGRQDVRGRPLGAGAPRRQDRGARPEREHHGGGAPAAHLARARG
ncbi:unnamed protein product, partial [Prorocentrum cordatum]